MTRTPESTMAAKKDAPKQKIELEKVEARDVDVAARRLKLRAGVRAGATKAHGRLSGRGGLE
jgi:hypothetical protein